ncbi:MAG TPA: hypothetical protein VM943_04215 [Pyrinomonadaceae bacterium]|nr:hypothetical protein [Pyrinomonadaceae bacterium]
MKFDKERLDAEWLALVAIREALGIAVKDKLSPTYPQSLALGKLLAPELYDPKVSLIVRSVESATAREFRQRAEVLSSLEDRDVSPLELLEPEIEEFKRLYTADPQKIEIEKKYLQLQDARQYLTPKKQTETQIILHDLHLVKRGLPLPPVAKDRYLQFKLSKERGLRIYLLHPDPPEHSMGADLIYETYWEKKKLARLAVVQYKICKGKALYTSQSRNLEEQMNRLKHVFCESGLCKPWDENETEKRYRLPHCTAFLRPTDEIQQPNSALISSGLHVPICIAQRSWEETGKGGRKIEKKKIRSSSVTHKVFVELFNANLLGSRWFTFTEIESLYKQHGLLDSTERIILHAQEFDI